MPEKEQKPRSENSVERSRGNAVYREQPTCEASSKNRNDMPEREQKPRSENSVERSRCNAVYREQPTCEASSKNGNEILDFTT